MDNHLSTNEFFANKELIFELTHQVLKSADNPAQASETLASQLRELTGARMIAIYTFNETHELQLNFKSPKRRTDITTTQAGIVLVNKTYRKKEISFFDTDIHSENYEPLLKEIGLEISIGVPLWLGKQNLGCVMILNLPSSHKIKLVLESMQSLSSVLGLVLRNAFLFEKQTQKLESSEAQMEALLNAREESIWSIDKNYRYLTFNTFFKESYKIAYKHSLKIGENCIEILPEKQKNFWKEKYNKVLEGEKIKFEFSEAIHDQILYFEVHLNPIYIDGEIFGISAISSNITERIKSETKLIESEQKYRYLADHTFDWEYWIDKDGEYKYVSPSCEKITGFSPQEFYQNKDLIHSLIHPDFKISVKEHYAKERENTSDLEQIEFKIINKKGAEIWIAHSCIPIRNEQNVYMGVRGVNRDITAKKKAENQLNILSAAVNQASVIVVITDATGSIEYVNPYFSEVTGYSFEESIGKNPSILKSGYTSKDEYKEIWDLLNSGKNWRGEFLNKKKNGDLFWEDATITPILNSKGEIEHFVAIKKIITQEKEMMNELVVSKEKAEESDRLKTEFLTNMSHEIRTPMNGIVGFSDLLNDPNAQTEDRKKFISVIQNSAHQLLKIIDDILEISRLETKQVKSKEAEVNINILCRQLFEVFNLKHKNDKLEFKMNCNLKDEESIILTDEIKLKKILSNLLENAFKFTSKGEIILGYQRNNNDLEIYVSDTGVGINPSAFTSIFDRFSQEEKEISQKAGGLGLGLSIAKENAELLGGKIHIESEKGKGSTFFLTIPYQPFKIKEEELNDTIIEISSIPTKHCILIAEDEEVNFEYLKILLEKMGPNFSILHAWDGEEAVELCKNNTDISLVFMDIKMPKLDGYEATKKIKSFRPNLPILAQTAYSTPEEVAKAMGAGCNEFISKPLNKNKIFKFVQQFLNVVF